MRFKLLGPIEVTERDRSLPLGGTKQRSLLAVLLLDANEIVSTDRLIAELWGDSPPATVAKSVQLYVSRLRAELGAERLVTHSPGYAVRVDPDELDLTVFERLCEEARRAPPELAAEKLRQALALWRGPPLGDLRYESFAQPAIARLEELYASALEQRIDADLQAGRHVDLCGELQPLVAAHPHRERLHGQLMLALYRSGRQADALRVYQAASRRLSEELGLQPGSALRQLERAILEQDPALDLPAPAAGARPAHAAGAPERSLLVVPAALGDLETLLSLAVPLASLEPPREIILSGVVPPGELRAATAALSAKGEALRARGLAVRAAAFSSPDPGADVASIASRHDVDLLVMDSDAPLEGAVGEVLKRAPCDVAVLIPAGGPVREGPVIVPFGAASHDWAALELGAWVARATGSPMRLVGAAADRDDGRDASRLLADASLILQRRAAVVAEPLLASPGRRGVLALAKDAGLLVVGFSERWQDEGLGRVRSEIVAAPPAPTVLVLRGPRPNQMAPGDSRTRFGWSITAGGGA